LQKDFENILGLLDKLSEVDTSSVVLWTNNIMQLWPMGSDTQNMDRNLFFANMKHDIRNEQMVVKHRGRE
jgi:Asp-tRNA(Asn)/Glu-tRNA(Gln) amidotransferase C subunit